ncbi:uncharacterized protein LOC142975245 [Anticarsia gemmatalis]|uniref:uncharacterized protein LOC142975245 n=1 Tax=Anticarsia gemmatalis TaxID=129554 RepID=UPI003F7579BA
MIGKCLALITALYTLRLICIVNSEAQKNYGAFNLSITQFDVCKGPKQKDCAHASATISSYNTLMYKITVTRNIIPSKGKIIASSNGKEFLRLQVKKTCEHLFLKPLLGALMNLTDNCLVQKGHYEFSIDIETIAKSYFGGTFVFGNWTFKSVFYGDDCNLSCSIIKVEMAPREYTSNARI